MLVLGHHLKSLDPEDIACNIFIIIGIHRDSAVMEEAFVLVEILYHHLFRSHRHHYSRGHNVGNGELVHIDDILDDCVFVLLKIARFLGDIGHRADLFPGYCGFAFFRGDELGEFLGQDYQREHYYHKDTDDPGRKTHQGAPAVCAYGLRYDFSEYQHEYGHNGAGKAEPLGAEDFSGLCAHASRSYRICYSIETQDSRNRAGTVLLEFFEFGGRLVALLLPHRDI